MVVLVEGLLTESCPADLEPATVGEIQEAIASLTPQSPSAIAPDDKSVREQALFQHQADQKKLDLGWIGKFIGHGNEKLGNIAALVIFGAFLLLVGLIWVPVASGVDLRDKTVSTVFSVITLALGYLFGRSSSGN